MNLEGKGVVPGDGGCVAAYGDRCHERALRLAEIPLGGKGTEVPNPRV